MDRNTRSKMSQKAAARTSPVGEESILVTQVVAHIVPGDSGMTMLGAAYAASASFIEENANGTTEINLSFKHGGATFEANYLPDRKIEEATPEAY